MCGPSIALFGVAAGCSSPNRVFGEGKGGANSGGGSGGRAQGGSSSGNANVWRLRFEHLDTRRGNVNGDLAGSFPNVSVPLVSLTEALTIGAYLNFAGGYSTGFINGDLDEVRLYDAGLKAAQVKAVMQE
jgi:hypothetical protein